MFMGEDGCGLWVKWEGFLLSAFVHDLHGRVTVRLYVYMFMIPTSLV